MWFSDNEIAHDLRLHDAQLDFDASDIRAIPRWTFNASVVEADSAPGSVT